MRIALAAVCAAAWLASVSCDFVPSYRGRTLAGEEFTSDSLKGRVVLVEFWATWCPYCRAEEPVVDQLESDYRGAGLMVLAVNVGESKEKVMQYLRQSRRHVRVVASEDTNLAEALGTSGYPTYVVIGRDGRVAGRQSGAGGAESLHELLAKAGLEPRGGVGGQ